MKKNGKIKTAKRRDQTRSRSPLVRSIAQARERLAAQMGADVEAAAKEGFKVLRAVATNTELDLLPEKCGSAVASRVAAAAKLMEVGGLLGRGSSVTVKKDQKDGKVTVLVRYEDAKPPEDEDG